MSRLIDLLNQYGNAKFGDEWWPGCAEAWLPADDAAELAALLEGGPSEADTIWSRLSPAAKAAWVETMQPFPEEGTLTMSTTHTTRAWPDPAEPIEIRLDNPRIRRQYKLVAWRTEAGVITHYMTVLTGTTPESVSNLQPKLPFPGKAVLGWQAEFIEAAASGLFDIAEVR